MKSDLTELIAAAREDTTLVEILRCKNHSRHLAVSINDTHVLGFKCCGIWDVVAYGHVRLFDAVRTQPSDSGEVEELIDTIREAMRHGTGDDGTIADLDTLATTLRDTQRERDALRERVGEYEKASHPARLKTLRRCVMHPHDCDYGYRVAAGRTLSKLTALRRKIGTP